MAKLEEGANTKNLTEIRAQVPALQALLSSLSPGQSQDVQNLSPDQVERLSEKLDQILGDTEAGTPSNRNKRGELLNEDGLPIIEVSEPLGNVDAAEASPTGQYNDDQELVPLSDLTPAQRAQRQLERDRILDLLEAEEEEQAAVDAELERQQKKEALERRKETAKAELARLKAAQEMQKRMGQALLRNMADAQERRERQDAAEPANLAPTDNAADKTPNAKKGVTFAASVKGSGNDAGGEEGTPREWGDVSMAPLRGGPRRTLVNRSAMDKLPMKMDVVERTLGPASVSEDQTRDSDDESIPDSPERFVANEEHALFDSESEREPSDESDPSEEEVELADDFDLSTAKHQREIALEYYRLRGTIGADTAKAMTSHTHTEGEDDWDQPEVPLEATLSSKPPKPSVSKFKARRASAFNVPSTSLGASVLSAEQSRTMQRAIHLGKLEKGQLVGEDDSDGVQEGDEGLKNEEAMLEMLKNGDVVNIGPSVGKSKQGLDISTTPVIERPAIDRDTPAPLKLPDTSISSDAMPASPSVLTKTSRFKATHTPAPSTPQKISSLTSASSISTVRSESSTPSTDVRRSSPKLPTSPAASDDVSKQPGTLFKKPPTVISTPSLRAPDPKPHLVPPPSFPPGGIIDSPSFPQPIVISSPSFPSPTNVSKRTAQPRAVMADVRESQAPQPHTGPNASKNERISRFKAERL